MLDFILELDKKALLFINSMNSPAWDNIMFWITYKWSWIPLYIVLVIVLIYRERSYRVIFTIIFAALVVTFCDQFTVFVRGLIERPRPTHEPELANLLHLVTNPITGNPIRGGQFGFWSAHAANSFGIAAYLSNQLKNYKWTLFLFAWAAIVSYSRMYLGVHYPLDIICGALIGALIGIQCYVFKVRTAVYVERKMEIRKEKKSSLHQSHN